MMRDVDVLSSNTTMDESLQIDWMNARMQIWNYAKMYVEYIQEMTVSKPTSKGFQGCECGNIMQWNKLTIIYYHETM